MTDDRPGYDDAMDALCDETVLERWAGMTSTRDLGTFLDVVYRIIAAAVAADRDAAWVEGTPVADRDAEIRRLQAERDSYIEQLDNTQRTLLAETYRPEGGEIVMRELAAAKRDRDEARAALSRLQEAVRSLRHTISLAPEPVEVSDLDRALRAALADSERPSGETWVKVIHSPRIRGDYSDEAREAATAAADMCPRCHRDNESAWALCARCGSGQITERTTP